MHWSSLSTKRQLVASLIALIISVLAVRGVLAQTGTTSVRGTVTDPHGASVPDATVSLTSSEIGLTLTARTDKDGAYQFLEVRPATYTMTVVAPGFATTKQTGLQLLVATPATNNIKL